MKVLVTGGAGYIGSITAEVLLAAGHEVVVFDNLSQGHRAAVPTDAVWVQGDLSKPSAIRQAMMAHRPEAVMHFAAKSLVGDSMVRPFAYLRDNVVEGLNLIEACVDSGVQRFILSSTANLFGAPGNAPVDEQTAIEPGSPYGESKWTLERALDWVSQTHGMRYAILRYFNAAGASAQRGEHHLPETHLIPLVLQVAAGQRDCMTVFGDDYDTPDGTCIRDYIHVLDLAQAHLKAMTMLHREGGFHTLNLGSEAGYSVREILEACETTVGRPITHEIGPRRQGDPARLVADASRAGQILDWRATRSLREIVESAWLWEQERQNLQAR